MKIKSLNVIKNNDIVRKHLAKMIALHCFRNTELENIHADGEVITNEVMKRLMIDVVDHVYLELSVLFGPDDTGDRVIELLKTHDILPEWNEPKIPDNRTPVDQERFAKEDIKLRAHVGL